MLTGLCIFSICNIQHQLAENVPYVNVQTNIVSDKHSNYAVSTFYPIIPDFVKFFNISLNYKTVEHR